MVKLLHCWLSRLTLFCLLAFAAGGAYAQLDSTINLTVEIEGDGSGTLSYYDWNVYNMVDVPLEEKTYSFNYVDVSNSFAIKNIEGNLLSIELDGVSQEGLMTNYETTGSFAVACAQQSDGNYTSTLKLFFEGGASEPEYDFLINLTVEGGEADVEAQYTGAEGRQTVDLVEGPNYISGITAGLMNRRGVTVFASDAEGYVIKEIYLNDEAQTVGRAIQLQSTTVPVEYDLRVVCEEDAPAASGLVLHCTIDGEGSADVKTYSSAGGHTEAQPVVNGDVVFDDVYQGLSYLPVTIENIQGELADIIIDGDTDNEQSTAAWNEYMNSGKQYASFKVYFVDGVCEATLDLVFASGEPQPTRHHDRLVRGRPELFQRVRKHGRHRLQG